MEQVKAVASALGVNDRPLVRQIDNLRELFTARNEISHELDLRDPQRHNATKRRPRNRNDTEALADVAFEVGQAVIDRVGVVLYRI